MRNRLFNGLMMLILVTAATGPWAAPTPATQPTPVVAGDGGDGGNRPSATQEAVKIGGGFALTGDEAVLDRPEVNGAKLAAQKATKRGGVLGRQIAFIIRNSQYDMAVTSRIAKEFVTQDKVVGLIGFTDTDSVLAAGPALQQASIPFITAGATSPKLPQQIGDLMFLACFGDNAQAAAGAEFAARRLGKTAYLLWDRGTEYTRILPGYFKTRFAQLGGTVVLEDSYGDRATDFSAQIARLKALPTQPDFYYVAAMSYNIGALVKQFRDAGLTAPIVGGDAYDDPSWIKADGAATNNVYFSTHVFNSANTGNAAYRTFFAAYREAYGQAPQNAFAALGYDAFNLLVNAIERAGSTDGQAIKKALEETRDFPGITGSISFSADSHVPRKSVTIIALKDGQYTLAEEFIPEKVPAP